MLNTWVTVRARHHQHRQLVTLRAGARVKAGRCQSVEVELAFEPDSEALAAIETECGEYGTPDVLDEV